ncbi:hypothetical protein MMC30_006836 [Trapelia coarctata]|nr:hypothetical protein [Trapelia coarctata]
MSSIAFSALFNYPESDPDDEDVRSRNNFLDCGQLSIASLEALVEGNLPSEVERWKISFRNGFVFSYTEFDLRIGSFSRQNGSLFQHAIENRELSRKVVDPLRVLSRQSVSEEGDTARQNSFDFAMLVLRLLEETTSYIQAYRESLPGKNKSSLSHRHPIGRIPDSTSDAAHHYLGKTPKEICADILPGYRIEHVESIIRSDLTRRFQQVQNEMRETLLCKNLQTLRQNIPHDRWRSDGASVEEAVEYLVKPRITFHGTRRSNVASIVQYGFLKPDDIHPFTKQPLRVACGNTYGRGIYTSPDPSFSLLYSDDDAQKTRPSALPGMKLLVCATIMGRTAQMYHDDNWREQDEPYPGADSHVANGGQEYIVFNSGQVLPCYVLHVDWEGNDDVEEFLTQNLVVNRASKPHPRLDTTVLYPGDKARLKQERGAQGSKFFAYGFGPVSGKNIVIEEIGEVDDDEEDYGEYQAQRVEGEGKVDVWRWGDVGGDPNIDEFRRERLAKRMN